MPANKTAYHAQTSRTLAGLIEWSGVRPTLVPGTRSQPISPYQGHRFSGLPTREQAGRPGSGYDPNELHHWKYIQRLSCLLLSRPAQESIQLLARYPTIRTGLPVCNTSSDEDLQITVFRSDGGVTGGDRAVRFRSGIHTQACGIDAQNRSRYSRSEWLLLRREGEHLQSQQ